VFEHFDHAPLKIAEFLDKFGENVFSLRIVERQIAGADIQYFTDFLVAGFCKSLFNI